MGGGLKKGIKSQSMTVTNVEHKKRLREYFHREKYTNDPNNSLIR